MKRTASSLLLLICLLLSGCSYNLYEKAGLIDPSSSISLEVDTVTTTEESFNLYALSESDTEYVLSIPASSERSNLVLLKMLSEDNEWRLIEALEFHKGKGTLDTFLSQALTGELLTASHGSVTYLSSLCETLSEDIEAADTYVEQLIGQLSEESGAAISFTLLSDLSTMLRERAEKLESESLTMEDYLIIQYTSELIGGVLEASLPLVALSADENRTLTLNAAMELLSDGHLSEESITAIEAEAEKLAAALLETFGLLDQIGRYTDRVPSVSDMIRILGGAIT